MPLPSKISQLPEDVRQWLERELIARGFSGYVELSELLAERGYEIGKSAVHKYGQRLDRKLSAIKASTAAARLIAEHAPDDEDYRSNAIISLVQTEIFDALIALQESEEEADNPDKRIELLGKAAKNIATLSRASVNRIKWAQEVKDRADRAAESVEKIARKGGLSSDAVDSIRREILGIAG